MLAVLDEAQGFPGVARVRQLALSVGWRPSTASESRTRLAVSTPTPNRIPNTFCVGIWELPVTVGVRRDETGIDPRRTNRKRLHEPDFRDTLASQHHAGSRSTARHPAHTLAGMPRPNRSLPMFGITDRRHFLKHAAGAAAVTVPGMEFLAKVRAHAAGDEEEAEEPHHPVDGRRPADHRPLGHEAGQPERRRAQAEAHRGQRHRDHRTPAEGRQAVQEPVDHPLAELEAKATTIAARS